MKDTILIVGYGVGISHAVAEKFGAAGYAVAAVARNEEKLAGGVAKLKQAGLEAEAFPGDAGQPESIRAVIGRVRETLGPVKVIHWNAYGTGAGDLLTAPADEVGRVFDAAVVGLVAAVQEALPQLRSTQGAVLVTNGAFGEINPQTDLFAVGGRAMGLAMANAAKHKLVGLLSARLKEEGVYVGEVMVAGTVKGTAWDRGDATLEASAIAQKFWDLYEGRREVRARVG